MPAVSSLAQSIRPSVASHPSMASSSSSRSLTDPGSPNQGPPLLMRVATHASSSSARGPASIAPRSTVAESAAARSATAVSTRSAPWMAPLTALPPKVPTPTPCTCAPGNCWCGQQQQTNAGGHTALPTSPTLSASSIASTVTDPIPARPVPIVAGIAAMAIAGAIIRIAISGWPAAGPPAVEIPTGEAISFATLRALLGPQIVGCLIMGWVTRGRAYMTMVYYPLYVSLATGLCGSITSFSTVMALAVGPLVGPAGYDWGGNLLASFFLLFAAFSSSIGAFHLGALAGTRVPLLSFPQPHPDLAAPTTAVAPARWTARLSARDQLVTAIGFVLWALAATAAAVTHRAYGKWAPSAQTYLALAVSPVGALARYYLAQHVPRPPMGTLVANWTAVLALGGLAVGVRVDPKIGWVMTPMTLGVCGCLSTVSTFVNELVTLPKGRAATYLLVSVVPSVVALVLMIGLPNYLHMLS
ncbi:hypothetical protein GGF32_007547 [Allomyces javanicus]|nr:hypothetical protein GGF32_007547 [Allomyces javanicus]